MRRGVRRRARCVLRHRKMAQPPPRCMRAADWARVVNKMRRRGADATVQASCCELLYHSIGSGSATTIDAAVAAGAIEAATMAVRAHPSDVEVQVFGLRCVAHMAVEPPYVQRAAACGAIEAAVAALRGIHGHRARLQRSALVLLNNIAGLPPHARHACDAGAVEAIAAVLDTDEPDPSPVVMKEACSALSRITMHDDLGPRRLALQTGALESVLATLALADEDDADLAAAAFGALGNITLNYSEAAARAGELHAVRGTLGAMRTHWDDETVQTFGCFALLHLVRGDEENAITALRMGAVDTVQAAQDALPGNSRLALYADTLIELLEQAEAAAEEAQLLARASAPRKIKIKPRRKKIKIKPRTKERGTAGGGVAANASPALPPAVPQPPLDAAAAAAAALLPFRFAALEVAGPAPMLRRCRRPAP
jgi:hypothetical protein